MQKIICCWVKPNRNGQIHVLGTHETLPKYMSQARDVNLCHSDWLKSALCVTQNIWWTAGTNALFWQFQNLSKYWGLGKVSERSRLQHCCRVYQDTTKPAVNVWWVQGITNLIIVVVVQIFFFVFIIFFLLFGSWMSVIAVECLKQNIYNLSRTCTCLSPKNILCYFTSTFN